MKYFLYKLIPPRPTFAQDMKEAEARLMQEHAAYWKGLMDRGLVVAFGPVLDPKGGYGVGIVELEDAADANDLGVNDPTIKANIGFRFEMYPMPRVIARERHIN